ncbi:hypothetical protein D9M69_733310 [compost metagenome]
MAAHLAGIAIERKQAEDRISFMAHHDALTGLPNRRCSKSRLPKRLKRYAGRGSGRCLPSSTSTTSSSSTTRWAMRRATNCSR